MNRSYWNYCKAIIVFSIMSGFLSCRDSDTPDVSDIKVEMQVQRFEQDFFAIDTNNISAGFARLQNQYPVFLRDFHINILGLPPVSDTSEAVEAAIKKFISDYRPIKDSVDKVFADLSDIEDDIKQGLQFVKHYFPNYRLPQKLITFIGPMDAYYEASLGGYGDVITSDALAVGLQLHLGSRFSIYKSEMGQALYPAYISRRFAPEYIPANCMKNIIDDMFPDNSTGKPLVEQMVEKGKRVYLLDRFLPRTHDTLKLGYTDYQLKGCLKNEGLIWNFFLTNGLLNNSEPNLIKNYIGDAPNTPEIGEYSPGNIGLFVGWRIVDEYMNKNPETSLQQLMQTDPRKLFEESKYRPK
jgi:hypothetical protein